MKQYRKERVVLERTNVIGGLGRGFGQFSWSFLTFMLGVRLFGGQSSSKNFF